MKRQYMILAGLAVLVAAFWYFTYSSAPTPSGLAGRALSAGKAEERAYAVGELTMLSDRQAVVELARVARESKDPEVVVIAVNKLASINYVDNLALYLALLRHDDARVAAAAYEAVVAQRGAAELDEAGYKATDPVDKRSPTSQRVAELIQEKNAEASARKRTSTTVASATSPASASKSPEEKDSAKPPPLPAPSIAPMHVPETIPAVGPFYDFTAMRMIAWLCRGLAFAILLAEVAATVIWLRGDSGQARTDKSTYKKRVTEQPPAAVDRAILTEDRLEKILAANSGRQWSETTKLFVWALCAIGMLLLAEAIFLGAHFLEKSEHAPVRIR